METQEHYERRLAYCGFVHGDDTGGLHPLSDEQVALYNAADHIKGLADFIPLSTVAGVGRLTDAI